MFVEPEIPIDPARIDGSALLRQALQLAAEARAKPDVLERLTGLAAAGAFAERVADALSDQAKAAKAVADRIMVHEIPDAMGDSGMDSFSLTDGRAVEIKQDIKASLTQENRPEGLIWLRDEGHDGVIDWSLSIPLGKGTTPEKIKEAVAKVKALGFDVVDNSKVHAQTLSALIRELMREGDDLSGSTFTPSPALMGFFIEAPAEDADEGDSPAKRLGQKSPADLFGVFMQQRAAIVAPRKRRSGK